MAEDEVRSGLHDRDGDRGAVLREHGGHADLLADDALRHCVLLAFPTANVRAACGAEAAAAGREAAPCVGGCGPDGSVLRGPRLLTRGTRRIKLGKCVLSLPRRSARPPSGPPGGTPGAPAPSRRWGISVPVPPGGTGCLGRRRGRRESRLPKSGGGGRLAVRVEPRPAGAVRWHCSWSSSAARAPRAPRWGC